ncbi:hypothetical protein U9M48_038172 [Paspalum notatum var. saurae]|uniref:Uncharacterized protein n=1 Tax=Paspalum notatum var. saurae TaxID=547442 RepID=A0AAQ3UMR9_PASNO
MNAVNDGRGPRGGLGGSGIASRSQTGATDGTGSPLAISPAALRNCTAPYPLNTRCLKQIPTATPPQVNLVTSAGTQLAASSTNKTPWLVQSTTCSPGLMSVMRPVTR